MNAPTQHALRAGAIAAACGALAALLAACGSLSTPPENFYTLSVETPAPNAPPSAASAPQVTVEVSLNEMVDRPQLVVRTGPNRVVILEQQRWGEPLKEAIARVVAADLRRVVAGANGETLHVALDVRRFESLPGDAVEIEAAWRAARGKSGEINGVATIREPARGAGYDALAAAHSRGLAKVSEQIAAAIATR